MSSYCLQWLFILPLEIIAGAFTITYWNPHLPKAIFVAIFLLAIVVINLFGIKGYGEAEFVFSIIKVTAVIGFMYVPSPSLTPYVSLTNPQPPRHCHQHRR